MVPVCVPVRIHARDRCMYMYMHVTDTEPVRKPRTVWYGMCSETPASLSLSMFGVWDSPRQEIAQR